MRIQAAATDLGAIAARLAPVAGANQDLAAADPVGWADDALVFHLFNNARSAVVADF